MFCNHISSVMKSLLALNSGVVLVHARLHNRAREGWRYSHDFTFVVRTEKKSKVIIPLTCSLGCS